ncbi:CocE/NonD family hydrolase [Paenibacillus naphthalenovorans]|uniref:CocE/NonD family hydrolase n=1 Tax=Paenibacillus naphthalenovorans TaxID=162209 RepID=UPI00201E4732|nr:CocE/NonD family hydrolase [Paenibacillus naphthalenovorans]
MTVKTMEVNPRTFTVSGEDIHLYLHTYGTVGIVSDIQISLVPKVPWSQWIVSFPSWEEAANGDLLVFGIPVILFKNEERLNRLMARCEEIGIGVANPHIWDMQEGGRSYSHDRLWDLERSFKPVKPEEAGGSVLRASYLLQDDTIRSSIVIFISGVLRMSRSSVCFGGVVVERKQPCTLRDGTVLYADIYRPDEPEKEYPVLLMRQPYGRAIASTVSHAHPLWYAQHGYIVVIQDVRGRGDSQGEFIPFIHEAQDGYDAVEWAAKLPGSTGRVGMYGFSYQGSTQWAAASAHPPHLKAIAPAMCAADLYHGMFYPHGRFAIREHLPWAYQLARDTARRLGDSEAERYCTQMMRSPDALIWQLPVLGEHHPVLRKYFPAYFEWCEHSGYDAYWAERDWLPKVKERPVPSLQIGGWYDVFLMGTMQSYEALQQEPGSPELFHRLIVGPWTHIPWGRKAGGVDHGDQADGDIHLEQVRWFDYWLKDKRDAELFHEPAIRYFERGSNVWRHSDRTSLMQPAAESSLWYLQGGEKPANGALGGGSLSPEEPGGAPSVPDVFVYDARLPMSLESYLPLDRSPAQDRYEILVYTSEPLESPMHILGSPKATIYFQTLGGPTDLVATLSVVLPDGTARFLAVGRTELSREQVEGWGKAEISLRPCALHLDRGSSIRLELTGSGFPLFARHPNHADADLHRAGAESLRIATVAVGSQSGMASFIALPNL